MRYALLVVISFIASQVCFAQIQLPDGTSPTGGYLLRDDRPISAWVAYDGLEPVTNPKVGSPAVQGQPLPFLSRYVVADVYPKSIKQEVQRSSLRKRELLDTSLASSWFLLGELSDDEARVEKYVGWVRGDYCIHSTRCLQTDKGILRKAMIINPYDIDDQMAAKLGRGEDGTVPVLLRPNARAQKSEKDFLWFSLFFVYGQTNEYLLLGSSPDFSFSTGSTSAKSVIQGWVRISELCKWNTREAYHWDRESTLMSASPRRMGAGLAFHGKDQAWQALRSVRESNGSTVFPNAVDPESVDDTPTWQKGGFLFEQFDEDGVTRELLPIEPRFPNLGYEGTALYPGKDPESGMKLVKIGCIGGVGKFDGKQGLSSGEISEIQRKLKKLLADMSTMEIVFLIDDTKSMEPWFDVVSRVVKSIETDVIDEFRTGVSVGSEDGVEKQIGEVRIAVSYYNGLRLVSPNKGKHVPQLGELKDVSQFGKNLSKAVRGHQLTKNVEPGRARVFDGIAKAVQAARFSESSRKMVILLGDVGDAAKDPDGFYEGLTRVLASYSAQPIEFYPVHVTDSNNLDRAAFSRQMTKLTTLVNQKANNFLAKAGKNQARVTRAKLFRVDSETPEAQRLAQVSSFILERYRDQKTKIESLQAQIERLLHGDWHSKMSTELVEELRKRNFPVDALQSSRGIQTFEEGFAWRECGLKDADDNLVPQLRLWALMSYSEIETLKNALHAIATEDRSSEEAILEAIGQQIQSLTGDSDESPGAGEIRSPASNRRQNRNEASSRSMREALAAKIPGLNSLIVSPLLAKAQNEIQLSELSGENILDIKRKAHLLEDILDRKVRTRKETSQRNKLLPKFTITREVTFDREYRIPGSSDRYYWVDVEKELP